MANVSRPSGFVPFGPILHSGTYTFGGTVYPGDLVTFNSSGQVIAASAGNALLGSTNEYHTTGQTGLVYDGQGQKYVAEVDDDGVDEQTDINLNYNFVATTGNTDYKISRQVIDGSTGAVDTDLPLKLLGIVNKQKNALGADVKAIVNINKHVFTSEVGALGV